MDFSKLNPRNQFENLIRKKEELDGALEKHLAPKNGALDFTGFKLQKERQQVKQELARLSFRFTPDTIA